MRAVINLSGNATTWFKCTEVNLGTITWDQLAAELHRAFCPSDFDQRVRDRLEQYVQTASIEAYTIAFC